MKISLYVPRERPVPMPLLRSEYAVAKNIKSKSTQKAILSGLKKITNVVTKYGPGHAFFSDGENVFVEDYDGKHSYYKCGKEYFVPDKKEIPPLFLVVIDSYEAAIGETDGERINLLWEGRSFVPNKHCKGGMSKNRFQRGRREVLKGWFRKVGEKVKVSYKERDILVGGPGMTKDNFLKQLPT